MSNGKPLIPVAVACVTKVPDKVLLVKGGRENLPLHNTLTFPLAEIAPMTSIERGLKAKILKNLGLRIKVLKLVHAQSETVSSSLGTQSLLFLFYKVRVLGGSSNPKLKDLGQWISESEVQKIGLQQGMADGYRELKKYI